MQSFPPLLSREKSHASSYSLIHMVTYLRLHCTCYSRSSRLVSMVPINDDAVYSGSFPLSLSEQSQNCMQMWMGARGHAERSLASLSESQSRFNNFPRVQIKRSKRERMRRYTSDSHKIFAIWGPSLICYLPHDFALLHMPACWDTSLRRRYISIAHPGWGCLNCAVHCSSTAHLSPVQITFLSDHPSTGPLTN